MRPLLALLVALLLAPTPALAQVDRAGPKTVDGRRGPDAKPSAGDRGALACPGGGPCTSAGLVAGAAADSMTVTPTGSGLKQQSVADFLGRIYRLANYTGVDCTGRSDSAAGAQAAVNDVRAKGGGGLDVSGCTALVDSADLHVPSTVFLVGPGLPGVSPTGDYSAATSSLVVNAAHTIYVHGSAGLRGFTIRRKGLFNPAAPYAIDVMANLYALVAQMAGTAVTLGDGSGAQDTGADATVEDMMILGFDTCVYASGQNRYHLIGNQYDCTNGEHLDRIYEVGEASNSHAWPFIVYGPSGGYAGYYTYAPPIIRIGAVGGRIALTLPDLSGAQPSHIYSTGQTVNIAGAPADSAANGAWTITRLDDHRIGLDGSTPGTPYAGDGGTTTYGSAAATVIHRAGIAFHGTNTFDHGRFVDDLDYGWRIGVQIDDSDHVQLINYRHDDWNQGNAPAGNCVRINGHSADSATTNLSCSGTAVGYLLSTVGTQNNQHSLVHPHFWGETQRSVAQYGGRLSVVGGTWEPYHETAGWHYVGHNGIYLDPGMVFFSMGGGATFAGNPLTVGGNIAQQAAIQARLRIEPSIFEVSPVAVITADADFTLTNGSSSPTTRVTATLTANRTATLSRTQAITGHTLRIVYAPAGATPHSLVIAGATAARAMQPNTWAEWTYDSSGWALSAAGSLN